MQQQPRRRKWNETHVRKHGELASSNLGFVTHLKKQDMQTDRLIPHLMKYKSET